MPVPKVADPKSLWQFTLYAFLIGLLGALTPEALKAIFGADEGHPWHAVFWWFGVFLIIAFILRVYDPAFRRWLNTRTEIMPLKIYSSLTVRSARGLVLLVSRGAGVSAGLSAVRYHRETLQHLWLIHSSDAGSVDGAARIASTTNATAHWKPLGDVFSIEMTKALVEGIRHEAHRLGVLDEDLICDFTGMTKPVSAGVVLACLLPEHRLQYMEPTGYLSDGRPDPGAGSRPVEIDVAYEIERA